MTKFNCPRHGDIGKDVLHVPTLLKLANVIDGIVPEEMGVSSNREYICARCAAEMIDAAFSPLRRK